MHDPLEMLLDGIFTHVHAISDFFICEPQHEVDDDHLFAFSKAIPLLDVHVRTFEFLIEFLHDDKEPAVSGEWRIRDTEPTEK